MVGAAEPWVVAMKRTNGSTAGGRDEEGCSGDGELLASGGEGWWRLHV